MQRPKQEGLGVAFGGGMSDQFMGAQASNILQRGTVYLTIALFLVTLGLSALYARKNLEISKRTKILDESAAQVKEAVPDPVSTEDGESSSELPTAVPMDGADGVEGDKNSEGATKETPDADTTIEATETTEGTSVQKTIKENTSPTETISPVESTSDTPSVESADPVEDTIIEKVESATKETLKSINPLKPAQPETTN